MTMYYLVTYDIVGIFLAIKVFPHTYHVTPLVTCDWASSPTTLRIGAQCTFSHRTLNFGRLQSQYFISGQRQNVITFSQKQGIIHRIRSAETSKPFQRLYIWKEHTSFQSLPQVFTCTLTLGKEGEAQFVGRKVLLRNFQNKWTFDLRVRLLGYSQGRQVIRKRPKGQKTLNPWISHF